MHIVLFNLDTVMKHDGKTSDETLHVELWESEKCKCSLITRNHCSAEEFVKKEIKPYLRCYSFRSTVEAAKS